MSLTRSTGMTVGKVCFGAAAVGAAALFAVPSVIIGAGTLISAGAGVYLHQDTYTNDPEARAQYRQYYDSVPLSEALRKKYDLDQTLKIFCDDNQHNLLRRHFEHEVGDGLLSTTIRRFDSPFKLLIAFAGKNVLPAEAIQRMLRRDITQAANFTSVWERLGGDLDNILRVLAPVLDGAGCVALLSEKFRLEFSWVGKEGQLYGVEEIVGRDQGVRPANPLNRGAQGQNDGGGGLAAAPPRPEEGDEGDEAPNDSNNDVNDNDDDGGGANNSNTTEAGHPLGLVRAFVQYSSFATRTFGVRPEFFSVALQSSQYGKRTALPGLVGGGLVELAGQDQGFVNPRWVDEKFLIFCGRGSEAAQKKLLDDVFDAAADGDVAGDNRSRSRSAAASTVASSSPAAAAGSQNYAVDLWHAESNVHLRRLLRTGLVSPRVAAPLFHEALPITLPAVSFSTGQPAPASMRNNIALFCEYWQDALQTHLSVLVQIPYQRAVAAAWQRRMAAHRREEAAVDRARKLHRDTVAQIERQERQRKERLERQAREEMMRQVAAQEQQQQHGNQQQQRTTRQRSNSRDVHESEWQMQAERRAAEDMRDSSIRRAEEEYSDELTRAHEIFVEDVERVLNGGAASSAPYYQQDNRAIAEAAAGATLNNNNNDDDDDDSGRSAGEQQASGCAQQ